VRGRQQAAVLARWRFYLVSVALLALAIILMGRLVHLQVTNGGQGAVFLREQGALRTVRSAEIPVYRGLITDRNGTPLAVSSPVVSLWANPQQLKDSPRLEELARLLGLDVGALRDKLAFYGDKQFMWRGIRHLTSPERYCESVLLAYTESGSTGGITLQVKSRPKLWG